MRLASLLFVVCAGVVIASCRTGAPLPPADEIVEGRTLLPVVVDTVDGPEAISVNPGKWTVRHNADEVLDFWSAISILDLPGAEHSARSVEERTFALALRTLMRSNPEDAAIAFRALHLQALDPMVRSRSRVGLTMALSWQSDWPSLAGIGVDPDTADGSDPLAVQAGVERWGRALSAVPAPVIDIPELPTTIPMRRSAFGTPVVTVEINGQPHEFWLDTGASMTLLSDEVAVKAGVKLAARDTLALSVVAGHIPARAVFVDSLRMGPVLAHGLGAALVNKGALRLDHRMVNGVREAVDIDGVIGTDLIRKLDLVIDARAGTITVRKPRRDPQIVPNLFWVGYPVVRLVTKDGRPVLLGLDTGAEVTYITTALLKKQPRTSVAVRHGSIGGLGTQEHTTEWVARQISLSDGGYAIGLTNVPVAPERRWTFVNFDGVIGSDVALASRLHLDFVNGVFDVRRSATNPLGGINVTIAH
ncbi:MAG: hypothetical protein JWM95_5119 [Gemmatimonadetes bacterium]|nr:hypothetical protein [Gemmatimonadota bacterium]